MTMMEGSMVAVRQAWPWDSNWELTCCINNHDAERANWERHRLLKSQSSPLVTHLLQQGHTSSTFPNSSTNWGSSFQIYEWAYRGHTHVNHHSAPSVSQETVILEAEINWQGTQKKNNVKDPVSEGGLQECPGRVNLEARAEQVLQSHRNRWQHS